MRARRLTLTSFVIAVVVTLAGCGGGGMSSSASPLKIVSVAADRTEGAHTAKVHVAASLTANGVHHTLLRADGVVDFAAGESSLHVVFPLSEINGHPDLTFDDRVVAGSVEYISWPGVFDLPPGVQWVRITPEDAGTAAANLQSQRADPSAGLQFLRGVVSEPELAGTATLDGASTTRYHVKFDILKVLERVPKKLLTPSFRAQVDKVRGALQTLGRDSLDGDVWIDDAGQRAPVPVRVLRVRGRGVRRLPHHARLQRVRYRGHRRGAGGRHGRAVHAGRRPVRPSAGPAPPARRQSDDVKAAVARRFLRLPPKEPMGSLELVRPAEDREARVHEQSIQAVVLGKWADYRPVLPDASVHFLAREPYLDLARHDAGVLAELAAGWFDDFESEFREPVLASVDDQLVTVCPPLMREIIEPEPPRIQRAFVEGSFLRRLFRLLVDGRGLGSRRAGA